MAEGYDYRAPRVIREYNVPVDIDGQVTTWDDGQMSRALMWPADMLVGARMAEWTLTVMRALGTVWHDDPTLRDPEFLRTALTDVRRVREVLKALEDELILEARHDDERSKAPLSWREIAEALQLSSRKSVSDRHEKLVSGEGDTKRGELLGARNPAWTGHDDEEEGQQQ
jgi:hypothetical protein